MQLLRGRIYRATIVSLSVLCCLPQMSHADAVCRERVTLTGYRQPVRFDDLLSQYRYSVFRVILSHGNNDTFEGNAGLISSDGYLITAAHVAMFARATGGTLWVERQVPEGVQAINRFKTYVVFQGTPAAKPSQTADDIALLKILNWQPGFPQSPLPIRYTGRAFGSGVFLAFRTLTRPLRRYNVTLVTLNPVDEVGALQGRAFYGRSGSPLFDRYGFVEGVVSAYNSFAEDQITAHGPLEKYAQFVDRQKRFGASQIVPGASWLSDIPIQDSMMNAVRGDCLSGNLSERDVLDLEGDARIPLVPLNEVFLACRTLRTNTRVAWRIRWDLLTLLSSYCAPFGALEQLMAGLTPVQVAEVGRLALRHYTNHAPGPLLVALGSSLPPLGADLPANLVAAIRDTPARVALREARVALSFAVPRAPDPRQLIRMDLIKTQYDLDASSGGLTHIDSAQARELFAQLTRAATGGAPKTQVADMATAASIQAHDWTAAAAFLTSKAVVLNSAGALDKGEARRISADLSDVAARSADSGMRREWVEAWQEQNSMSVSDKSKILGFASSVAAVQREEAPYAKVLQAIKW